MATSEVQPAHERVEAERTRRVWNAPWVFPVLIFFILTGFFWKLTLTRQYDWMWGPDLAQQVLPWFEEESRQIQHSRLPLWNTHEWLGQPLLAQAQPGGAYPLNWILFLLPRSHGHILRDALQWYFIAIHFMAALFCFLLCRDLGRSRSASLLGSLVFSLASYVGTIDWPQMVNGAVWAPLVLMFLLRVMRGYRPLVSAALCGTSLGMAWLAGHHQVPLYLTVTMLGVWLYNILRGGTIHWNMVKLLAICLLFTVLVSALQVLPAEEYGKLAKRWVGADREIGWSDPVPYYVHQEYSLYPMSIFGIVIPAMARHADPFIGVIAFSLALFAVATCWRDRYVKLFSAIAAGGLIYSLGHNSVFHGVLYSVVPMLEKARTPSMAVIIWSTGAAVLAAFGIDELGSALHSIWARRLTKGAVVFAIGLYAVILAIIFARSGWQVDDRVGITALVAILFGAVLHGWRTANLTPRVAFTLVLMLMLLELGNVTGYTFPHRADKDRQSYKVKAIGYPDIAAFLHAQPGLFRVERQTDKLVGNWAEYYDLDAVEIQTATVLANMLETEWHTWQAKLLYGVRYTVSEKPPLQDSIDVYTSENGLKVYKNPSAFPRLWTVHELFHIDDSAQGRLIISNHLSELYVKALTLGKAVSFPKCQDSDDVQFKQYAPEQVIIAARMGCEGLVVLSDAYFPGWQATVDGNPTEILPVDLNLRGVVVPKGKHELVMHYRPRSVYIGAVLTLMGWLGAIGLAIFGPKS